MKTMNVSMSGLTLVMLLMLFPINKSNASDQGVKYTNKGFEQVLQQAAEQQKPIFIKAYAEWCGACTRMDSNTMSEASVAEMLNDHFISMHVDIEKGEGPMLVKKFGISSLPGLIFISPEGEVIKFRNGYMNPRRFSAQVLDVLDTL